MTDTFKAARLGAIAVLQGILNSTEWDQDEIGRPRSPELRRLYDRILARISYIKNQNDEVGPHATHCCPTHGCKYHDGICPVELGLVAPTYPENNGCEVCESDREQKDAARQPLAADLEKFLTEFQASGEFDEGDAYDRGYRGGLLDAIRVLKEGAK